jgi:predicted RNase H-like HicB family nuclease
LVAAAPRCGVSGGEFHVVLGAQGQAGTAVIRKDEGWWIGWVQEISGVNSQGKTRAELLKNLRSALREAIELNREEALAQAGQEYEEAPLKV